MGLRLPLAGAIELVSPVIKQYGAQIKNDKGALDLRLELAEAAECLG